MKMKFVECFRVAEKIDAIVQKETKSSLNEDITI